MGQGNHPDHEPVPGGYTGIAPQPLVLNEATIIHWLRKLDETKYRKTPLWTRTACIAALNSVLAPLEVRLVDEEF